jgi:hypothetical protein
MSSLVFPKVIILFLYIKNSSYDFFILSQKESINLHKNFTASYHVSKKKKRVISQKPINERLNTMLKALILFLNLFANYLRHVNFFSIYMRHPFKLFATKNLQRFIFHYCILKLYASLQLSRVCVCTNSSTW